MLRAWPLVMLALLGMSPHPRRYDDDGHLWLGTYLGLEAGLTVAESTRMASANVSIDLDRHTSCAVPMLSSRIYVPTLGHSAKGEKFHAFYGGMFQDRRKKEHQIEARLEELWKKARERKGEDGTVMAGEATHFTMDFFAHQRNMQHYNRVWGHIPSDLGIDQADDLAARPGLAKVMALSAIAYLENWRSNRENSLGRDIIAELRGIASARGSVEEIDYEQVYSKFAPKVLPDYARRSRLEEAIALVSGTLDPGQRLNRIDAFMRKNQWPPLTQFTRFHFDSDGKVTGSENHNLAGTWQLARWMDREEGPEPEPRVDDREIERITSPSGTCPAEITGCGSTHRQCPQTEICLPAEIKMLGALLERKKVLDRRVTESPRVEKMREMTKEERRHAGDVWHERAKQIWAEIGDLEKARAGMVSGPDAKERLAAIDAEIRAKREVFDLLSAYDDF